MKSTTPSSLSSTISPNTTTTNNDTNYAIKLPPIQKKVNSNKNEMLTAKISENEDTNNDTNRRKIQLSFVVVIINKLMAIPVTIEFRPNHGISSLNVAKVHRNIFSRLKLNDPTLKMITFQNVTIYTLLQFLDKKKCTSILLSNIINCSL